MQKWSFNNMILELTLEYNIFEFSEHFYKQLMGYPLELTFPFNFKSFHVQKNWFCDNQNYENASSQ